MGKKEDTTPKSNKGSDEMVKELEDVDDDAVVDEIPDEVLLNEPLDDHDLIEDIEIITTGKKPKESQKSQKKLQSLRKKGAQQSVLLNDPETDEDLLSEMEVILSGKVQSQTSSKLKAKSSVGREIQSSIYLQIIHSLSFLALCLVGGYYIPQTLVGNSVGKYVLFTLHCLFGVVIITGGVLYFRIPRIAVLLTFIGMIWIGFAWILLYVWIGLPLTYGWWGIPLFCVAISGTLGYFSIQCVLHDPRFVK